MNKFLANIVTANSNCAMCVIEKDNTYYTLTKADSNKMSDLENNNIVALAPKGQDLISDLNCEVIVDQEKVLKAFDIFTTEEFNHFKTDNTNLVLLKMAK